MCCSRLLGNLKYVVVDEGHAYKGVFGCHAALVLRRLRRLCDRVYHSRVGDGGGGGGGGVWSSSPLPTCGAGSAMQAKSP